MVRLGAHDFENSSIDWTQFDINSPTIMVQRERNSPREHQLDAINAVLNGFQEHDRGKLIMACGTGKTFTALRIAEQQTKPGDVILFLAPSITLVSQSIREWANQATDPMLVHVVCSDTKAGKVGDEDTSATGRYDLVAPATTDFSVLLANVQRTRDSYSRTIIFSTYQSLAGHQKCPGQRARRYRPCNLRRGSPNHRRHLGKSGRVLICNGSRRRQY